MMKYQKLSIIVPVYNEKETLPVILQKLIKLKLPVKKEIIAVDDGSTDGSRNILERWTNQHKNINLLQHRKNRGKGRAIRTALKQVTGDVVVIQDADLEYDPKDLPRMLRAMNKNDWPVIYGSRHLRKKWRRHAEWYFYVGGLLLVWLTNRLYNLKLTDEATGYKMIETKLLKSLKLTCQRFEFCPEVTAKLAKLGVSINEIPIKYKPRLIPDGKKIRWHDGIEAVGTLVKWWYK